MGEAEKGKIHMTQEQRRSSNAEILGRECSSAIDTLSRHDQDLRCCESATGAQEQTQNRNPKPRIVKSSLDL